MYWRITTIREKGHVRRYVQIAESVREGKQVRVKVLAHLGPLEKFKRSAPTLLRKLAEMTGHRFAGVVFEQGQDVGNVLPDF